MTGRIDADQLGLLLAHAWALRGTCARRLVGCVLFDVDGKEIGTGYNGPSAGQPHCRRTGSFTDRPCAAAGAPSGTALSECEAIHAESNALIRCRSVDLIDVCFTTSSPCLDCVKLLMNTSCRRIVFAEAYTHDAAARDRWLRSSRAHRERTWEHVLFHYAICGANR